MPAVLEEKRVTHRRSETMPERSDAGVLADDLISRMFPATSDRPSDRALQTIRMPGTDILTPLMTCHGGSCGGSTCGGSTCGGSTCGGSTCSK